jgi:hypothetical protein
MNRGGMAGQGSGNNVGNVEVTAITGGIANANRLVGQLHMKGMAIYGGMNSNSGNPHFFTGA